VSTFTETTAKITVHVEPTPIVEESSPNDGSYAFAYSIRIENNSNATVQLLERHWFIESAGEQINEVQGPGVVGVQPVLEPGQVFEYTSSAVIRDPVGAMYGTYIFSRKTGGFFTVQIPRFKLLYPMMFN
jgi:ApaG protein